MVAPIVARWIRRLEESRKEKDGRGEGRVYGVSELEGDRYGMRFDKHSGPEHDYPPTRTKTQATAASETTRRHHGEVEATAQFNREKFGFFSQTKIID